MASRTTKTAKKSPRAKQAASKAQAAAKPKSFRQALETSHEYALAGLGMVSRMNKDRAARMAEFVAEGKKVESQLQERLEEYKAKVQSKVDVKKLTLPKFKLQMPRFDAAKLKRFGLAARQ